MRAVDLIAKKRDGQALSVPEIGFLIKGYVAGDLPDYQLAAFLMAVYFKGMTFEETAALTQAMLDSGSMLDLSPMAGPFIDKHSTGGVGDKISLILAPVVAACGVKVPMLCGRGLGHTGGTIDKLESISGYKTVLGEDEIRTVLQTAGFVFMSQTDSIAPADKLLYALRDVTGTVESIPLITASILSKKAAEGADGFVFDVKAGSGAFMKTKDDAERLARSLVNTAVVLGKKARALVTAMDEPLGRMVGNLAEIKETVACLLGEMPRDIAEITFGLGGRMLRLAGTIDTDEKGIALCREALEQKRAYKLFLKNIQAQGGDPDAIADPSRIRLAPRQAEVRAERGGFVALLDAYRIGLASVLLGAGRAAKESKILPGAGIELVKKCGEPVTAGDVLCRIYYEEGTDCQEPAALIKNAYAIEDRPPLSRALILTEMDGS